jgi:RND family efflux transporter MFP subunit
MTEKKAFSLPQPKKSRFTKKKAVLLAAILAAGLLAWRLVPPLLAKKDTAPSVRCTALAKTTLKDAVSVTGTVRSKDPANVYSTLTLPVAKVSVSVGDTVKKGDVLAVLDSSSLEKDIRQQEYTASYADKSAALALQKAKSDYENALSLYKQGLGADLTAARSSLEQARTALQTEKEAYGSAQYSYERGQISKLELNQQKAKLDQAQATCDSAEKSVASAQNASQQSLLAAKNAYEAAAAKTADKSAHAALDKLRSNLQDCVITAPRGGTVTAVGASVGSAPAGVLFKIEDPADLIVEAELKEADTAKANPGDPVVITTDATGDAKIAGRLLSIAPAANTKTEGTGNVTFPVKIRVSGRDPKLKIGMRAKANITLTEKKGVYAVPYESLADAKNGGYAVYAAKKDGDAYRVTAVPVTLGLQTDVLAEISGPGLKDGLPVVAGTDGVVPGAVIRPAVSGGGR